MSDSISSVTTEEFWAFANPRMLLQRALDGLHGSCKKSLWDRGNSPVTA